MGKLPEYPAAIRERAVQLIEKENLSYAQAAEQLKEEFKDTQGIEKISKSTVYRWVRQARKNKEKELSKEKPNESKIESSQDTIKKSDTPQTTKEFNIPNDSIENLSKELKQLPETTPEQVVKELNESITPVPEGPLMKEETPQEETEEPKSKKLADKLIKNKSKLLWSVSLTLAVSVIAYLLYRWWSRKHNSKFEPESESEIQTKQENSEKYSQVTSPEQFEESDYGFADAEVLP